MANEYKLQLRDATTDAVLAEKVYTKKETILLKDYFPGPVGFASWVNGQVNNVLTEAERKMLARAFTNLATQDINAILLEWFNDPSYEDAEARAIVNQ